MCCTSTRPRRPRCRRRPSRRPSTVEDRKSTRLNSSHANISYAVFCLNVPATTELSTLSLHDALPISTMLAATRYRAAARLPPIVRAVLDARDEAAVIFGAHGDVLYVNQAAQATLPPATITPSIDSGRSEEHTSELQSRQYLVCRLLLERSSYHRALHSFPTRRSSDLDDARGDAVPRRRALAPYCSRGARCAGRSGGDFRSPRRCAVRQPGRAGHVAAGDHHAVHRQWTGPSGAGCPGRGRRAVAGGRAGTG